MYEVPGFIGKPIPDINIGNAGLTGGLAIERIQEQGVGGRLGAANRGQTNPEDRHSLRFQDGDQVLDLLGVELAPALLAKLIDPRRGSRARRGERRRVIIGCSVAGQFGVDRSTFRLGGAVVCRIRLACGFVGGLALGLRAGVRLVALFVGFIGARIANRCAIIKSEHHHDGIGLLRGEDAFRRRGPIGRLSLGLISD